MRHIAFVLVALFAAALPCQAQGDKALAGGVAEGWLSLLETDSIMGWTIVRGEVRLDKVQLSPAFPKRDVYTLTTQEDKGAGVIRLNTAFQEFELSVRYSTPHVGAGTIYLCPADAKEHHAKMDRFALPGSRMPTSASFKVTGDSFWGKTSTKTDGDVEFPETKRADPNKPISLVFESGSVQLHSIHLRPLGAKSIFNGKDLTGWKEFPGKKSKFTVTDKGEINCKDGPGDLQTVGKYKDFVLQLECISNGKHLNSGIFFRCRDNEYQNGYEAQIRNQFTEKPTQKYTIEEYDPLTNKLRGKKDILSTAVDYGTGAIYRRVPARKEMARDGEWFGMTIVAHGNHLATWVNGVQVTDFTDNRPKSDNARTGCKLDAGHISIQGHDPTTDLSFRNFRIAEMAAGK